MKKFILILIAIFLIVPLAQAATLFSQNYNSLYKNETKDLWPITVTADTDGEITAEKGINLILDSQAIQILWDAVPTLTATGTAVDHSKIAATPAVQYINDYSVLHIPVLEDFSAGENVTFNGIRLRAYHYDFGTRYIGLDINGDYVADVQDVNRIEVISTALTDHTPPYPPTNFTATLATDLESVTLTWTMPPDFDLIGAILDRKITRGGQTREVNVFSNMTFTTYTDTVVQLGDVITYKLYATDNVNYSDKVEQTVEVKGTVAPETEPPATEPPTKEEKTEIDMLNSLYNYYKVRYAIKCLSPTTSLCLWAKIDIVYTQELTGKSDVSVSLSANEISLISSRIKWPEARYQTKCVEAEIPDKTCPALEKSLKRAHYFID